jgi:hypothetical protein
MWAEVHLMYPTLNFYIWIQKHHFDGMTSFSRDKEQKTRWHNDFTLYYSAMFLSVREMWLSLWRSTFAILPKSTQPCSQVENLARWAPRPQTQQQQSLAVLSSLMPHKSWITPEIINHSHFKDNLVLIHCRYNSPGYIKSNPSCAHLLNSISWSWSS